MSKKEIIKLYMDTVQTNMKSISISLKEFGLDNRLLEVYEALLASSSNMITNKWKNNAKYLRSEFVLKAYKENYPKNVLQLSISIDAMINILDDLLDENLKKEEKMLYVLEYLRIFSIYESTAESSSVHKNMSSYFNKLIMLAIVEEKVLEKIKTEESINKQIKLAKSILLSRSQDIDIFIDIVNEYVKLTKEETQSIRNASRQFRAINIFKKDIHDLEHDLQNGQDTIVTVMHSKGKKQFHEFVLSLLKEFNAKEKISPTPISAQFYVMLRKEHTKVLHSLNK